MAVAAITPDYSGERLDRVENFHGNIVVYVGWDRHLMFCSPVAFATPPDTTFGKLVDELISGAFAQHPDFAKIDWNKVTWLLNGESFTPDRAATLEALGVDHKSVFRMQTPGLDGIGGTHT